MPCTVAPGLPGTERAAARGFLLPSSSRTAMPRNVAVLVGSLRKESFTRKVATQLIALAPPPLSLEIVEIRDLAHYDEDLEANVPAAWTAFRDRMRAAEAVLFATPEYN